MGKKKKKYTSKQSIIPSFINHITLEAQYPYVPESIPDNMVLDIDNTPGFFFGYKYGIGPNKYIGMKQGLDGHILANGGSGSGKSSGIAKPTLATWKDAILAIDIKGELSNHYHILCDKGIVKRPYIVFNPLNKNGFGYDPFHELEQVGEQDLLAAVWEITLALCPTQPNDPQPFWIETEQGILAAALLYYFRLGLSFSEAINMIIFLSIPNLVKEINDNGQEDEKAFLGNLLSEKQETLALHDRGLRNKLMLFTTDPYIAHSFRGKREGAEYFTWDDLNKYNIFFDIPENRIEQWGRAINLMLTQLIRHLMRRPDKYSSEGANNMQTLLLLDEVARFGKLDILTNALATLRSKCVNICLMVQSVAQLDKIYGEADRRIILDNCQYQVILRANDPETQKYFCELIGTKKGMQLSFGETLNGSMKHSSYSRHISECLEWEIQPHEFSTLTDVLLLSPDGFFRLEKAQCRGENVYEELHMIAPREITAFPIQPTDHPVKTISLRNVQIILHPKERVINEKGEIQMLTAEERMNKAAERAAVLEHQRRLKKREEENKQKEKSTHRNFIIGELVSKYFPEVRNIDPGTNTENADRFKPLEIFLSVLSSNKTLMEELKKETNEICLTNKLPNSLECVSGHPEKCKATDIFEKDDSYV